MSFRENTAPADHVAALNGSRADPNTLVLLVPADHVIAGTVACTRAIEPGAGAANGGALVTFGVQPDCPHTGYAYIETAVAMAFRRSGGKSAVPLPPSERTKRGQ
jgi:mannose-1-phosphate guanylyltransferase / mannose-6-phosphate isomerase